MAQVKIEDALMDAVEQRDVVKVKTLCAHSDISRLELLTLTKILLSACPKKAGGREQAVLDALMDNQIHTRAGIVAFNRAYASFLKTMLWQNEVQEAIDWVNALPEHVNINLNYRQCLHIFALYFNFPDTKEQKPVLSFEQYVKSVTRFIQKSRYGAINDTSLAHFFDPVYYRALDEYKMDFVETLLSLKIPFNHQGVVSSLIFYDKHIKRKYDADKKTFIRSTITLNEWLDYLHALPLECANFLSFGYKVYFEGKDECLPPSVVLEFAPECHYRHIMPFVGAGL